MIVSTPQDVALTDVNKGVAMFRKLNVPITGIVLNQSHFLCSSCSTPHYLYGAPDGFREAAKRLNVDILAELAVVSGVSKAGDAGVPYAAIANEDGTAGEEWNKRMMGVAVAAKAALNI